MRKNGCCWCGSNQLDRLCQVTVALLIVELLMVAMALVGKNPASAQTMTTVSVAPPAPSGESSQSSSGNWLRAIAGGAVGGLFTAGANIWLGRRKERREGNNRTALRASRLADSLVDYLNEYRSACLVIGHAGWRVDSRLRYQQMRAAVLLRAIQVPGFDADIIALLRETDAALLSAQTAESSPSADRLRDSALDLTEKGMSILRKIGVHELEVSR